MDPDERRPVALAAGALVLLFAWLFRDVLFLGGTFVHGDALGLGLPMQTAMRDALRGEGFPLWAPGVFGGHPLFAEGQGAFAHPLALLVFGTLPLAWAHGAFHYLLGLIAAGGTLGLCREAGASAPAALFGALALAGAQSWLGMTGNPTIALAVAWVPAALWLFERWWRKPSLGRAAALAAAAAAVLLAGYPQAAHALFLYLLVSAGVRLVAAAWAGEPLRLAARAATGVAAAALALGLAAVQLLPTLELAGLSVRAGGAGELLAAEPLWQLRGLLFTATGPGAALMPGLGSVLVASAAAAAFALCAPRVVLVHALPIWLLVELSFADASLLHPLLGALPGVAAFRTTQLYMTVALVGVALLAALAVEGAARYELAAPGRGAIGLGLVAGVLVVALLVRSGQGAPLQLLVALVVWGAALGLLRAGRSHGLLPLVFCAALVLELLVVRGALFAHVPREVVAEPPAAAFLAARHPERRAARVATVPPRGAALGFAPSNEPALPARAARYLASLGASANLLWDVPSLQGDLALPLARRAALEPVLEAEVRGRSLRPPGERAIDRLSLRYVSVPAGFRPGDYAPDLREVFRDEAGGSVLLENPSALPPIRLASRAQPVADAAAALGRLAAPPGEEAGALLVEGDAGPAAGAPSEGAPGRWVLRGESSDALRIDVDLDRPGWLFVADAPYPGWHASVDGAPATLLAADVLGKAVPLGRGRHEVELRFASGSVRLGVWISLLSALVAAGIAGLSFPQQARPGARG